MIKVFVYGTLRTNEGNWRHFLENKSKKLCNDEITGFVMYDLGYFPAIVPGDSPEGKVIGEVFEVNEETLRRLDHLEGYSKSGNGLYNRKEILTKNGHEAFVYFMNKEPSRRTVKIIESGDWLNK